MKILRWLYGRSIVSVHVKKINVVYRDFLENRVNAIVEFEHLGATKTCNVIIRGEPQIGAILHNLLVADRSPDVCREVRFYPFLLALICVLCMLVNLRDVNDRYRRIKSYDTDSWTITDYIVRRSCGLALASLVGVGGFLAIV